MNRTKYTLTLSIPVEVWSKTGHASALCDAKASLEDSGYEDGRHPFAREMFVRALSDLLRGACFESVDRLMKGKYGNERIEDETGSIIRHYAETEKWMRDDLSGISIEQDGWNVEIDKVKGE